MKDTQSVTLMVAVSLVMSACGSSDGSTEMSGDLGLGSTSQAASANGLPFAEDGFDETNGYPEITVKLARFASDNQTGETLLQITSETVNIEQLGENSIFIDGAVSYAGEVINFNDSNGIFQEEDAFIFSNITGNESVVYNIYSYKSLNNLTTSDAGLNTEGSFVIGLETNPANIENLQGSAYYAGDFRGYGTVLDTGGAVVGNEVLILGEIGLTVDFSDDRIGGAVYVFARSSPDSPDQFVFDTTTVVDPAAINGNGFTASADNVLVCFAATCDADIDLVGTFYGSEGAELSGISTVDLTELDENGDGYRLMGAAGFITSPAE